MIKVAALVCSTAALIVLAPKTADASTNITCTVTSVLWQKYSTPAPQQPSGVPTDILVIGCSDNNGYGSYIGSPSEVALAPPAPNAGCYASPDSVKSFATLATAALLSGKTLSIWWTARSCPGNAGQLSIDSVTLQLQ
jgi:hypothetical protein